MKCKFWIYQLLVPLCPKYSVISLADIEADLNKGMVRWVFLVCQSLPHSGSISRLFVSSLVVLPWSSSYGGLLYLIGQYFCSSDSSENIVNLLLFSGRCIFWLVLSIRSCFADRAINMRRINANSATVQRFLSGYWLRCVPCQLFSASSFFSTNVPLGSSRYQYSCVTSILVVLLLMPTRRLFLPRHLEHLTMYQPFLVFHWLVPTFFPVQLSLVVPFQDEEFIFVG
jgi:hypothetical protein